MYDVETSIRLSDIDWFSREKAHLATQLLLTYANNGLPEEPRAKNCKRCGVKIVEVPDEQYRQDRHSQPQIFDVNTETRQCRVYKQ